MKPSNVKRSLKALLPTGRSAYLWGPPGVSKSQIVHQTAEELGLDVLDWRALLRDPVDARGVPSVRDGLTHWNPPAEFPREGKGILFLDEVAQAPTQMQQVCGQLALERKCGEYHLPEGWYVVAASNRQEDRAGAVRSPTNVLNRFIHLDVEVDNEDWQAWAVQNSISVRIRSFLNFRPNLLFKFDPSKQERACATPRSWHMLSDLLAATPSDLISPIASGTVGEGPAAEFVAFDELAGKLPEVDAILADPKRQAVPDEPAVLYALCGALSERMRKADGRMLTAFVEYMERMPLEFGTLALRDAVNANRAVANYASAWLKANGSYLAGWGR